MLERKELRHSLLQFRPNRRVERRVSVAYCPVTKRNVSELRIRDYEFDTWAVLKSNYCREA